MVGLSQDRVLGATPQRLAVPQLGAVQLEGQAVRQRPLVELPAAHTLVHPAQVGAGIRPQPGAVEAEVLGVRGWFPHTQRVSVWNICSGATERRRSFTVVTAGCYQDQIQDETMCFHDGKIMTALLGHTGLSLVQIHVSINIYCNK